MLLDGWPGFKEDWQRGTTGTSGMSSMCKMMCYTEDGDVRQYPKGPESIGGEACYRRARDTLFWLSMRAEIKDFVANYSACNEYARNQQKEPIHVHGKR